MTGVATTADAVLRAFSQAEILVLLSGTTEVSSAPTLQSYVSRRTGLELHCMEIGLGDIPSCFSKGQMGTHGIISQRLRNAKRKQDVRRRRRVFFLELLPTHGTKQLLAAMETFVTTLQLLKRRSTKKLKLSGGRFVDGGGQPSGSVTLPLLVIFAREREEPPSFWVVKSKRPSKEYLKLSGSIHSLRSELQYGQRLPGTAWTAVAGDESEVPASALQPRFRIGHAVNGTCPMLPTDSHPMDVIRNNEMVTFVFKKVVPTPDQWAFSSRDALTFLGNCYPKDTFVQRKSMSPIQYLKDCLSDADLLYANMTSGGAVGGDDLCAVLYGSFKSFRAEVPDMDFKDVQEHKAKQSVFASEQRRNRGDIRVVRDSFPTLETSLDILGRLSLVSSMENPTLEIGPLFPELMNKQVHDYFLSVCGNTGVFDLTNFPAEGDGATSRFVAQRQAALTSVKPEGNVFLEKKQ
jgi:hypothetical protein